MQDTGAAHLRVLAEEGCHQMFQENSPIVLSITDACRRVMQHAAALVLQSRAGGSGSMALRSTRSAWCGCRRGASQGISRRRLSSDVSGEFTNCVEHHRCVQVSFMQHAAAFVLQSRAGGSGSGSGSGSMALRSITATPGQAGVQKQSRAAWQQAAQPCRGHCSTAFNSACGFTLMGLAHLHNIGLAEAPGALHALSLQLSRFRRQQPLLHLRGYSVSS